MSFLSKIKSAFYGDVAPTPAPRKQLTAFYVAEPGADGHWYVTHPEFGQVAGPYSHELALSVARQSNIEALAHRNNQIREMAKASA